MKKNSNPTYYLEWFPTVKKALHPFSNGTWTRIEDVWILFKMMIFQPAMLVYWRVGDCLRITMGFISIFHHHLGEYSLVHFFLSPRVGSQIQTIHWRFGNSLLGGELYIREVEVSPALGLIRICLEYFWMGSDLHLTLICDLTNHPLKINIGRWTFLFVVRGLLPRSLT